MADRLEPAPGAVLADRELHPERRVARHAPTGIRLGGKRLPGLVAERGVVAEQLVVGGVGEDRRPRRVDDQHGIDHADQDRFQAGPGGLALPSLVLERDGEVLQLDAPRLEVVVGGVQLLDRRLELLVERFQLLVAGLELLVECLDLLGGGLDLLGRDHQLLVRAPELLVDGGQLLVGGQELAVGLDLPLGLRREALQLGRSLVCRAADLPKRARQVGHVDDLNQDGGVGLGARLRLGTAAGRDGQLDAQRLVRA